MFREILATSNTTTVTETFTSTRTTTQQLPAPGFIFGIPTELWLVGIIVIGIVGFYFFRTQVRDIPVNVLWVFRNGHSRIFRASEDLGGVFLNVMDWKGKKAETLKKTGEPLEVTYMPERAKTYIIEPETKHGKPLTQETMAELEHEGFRLREETDRKGKLKAYIATRPPKEEKELAYIDAHLGGLKTARLFVVPEGTGSTFDVVKAIQGLNVEDPGNTSLLHEERGAAKAALKDYAEAAAGSFRTLVIPLVAGLGIGGMISLLFILLTGHYH